MSNEGSFSNKGVSANAFTQFIFIQDCVCMSVPADKRDRIADINGIKSGVNWYVYSGNGLFITHQMKGMGPFIPCKSADGESVKHPLLNTGGQ